MVLIIFRKPRVATKPEGHNHREHCFPSPGAKLYWSLTVFVNLEYLSFFEDGALTTVPNPDWKIFEDLIDVKTPKHSNLHVTCLFLQTNTSRDVFPLSILMTCGRTSTWRAHVSFYSTYVRPTESLCDRPTPTDRMRTRTRTYTGLVG